MAQCSSGALSRPTVGLPTMMTTASEPASTTAHTHSQRVTRLRVSRA
ncbi:Uncharacterised protein [Mycobacterium tuberculosis]|nr:Uncharacterised protein [Mycobacterium tuberculosis]